MRLLLLLLAGASLAGCTRDADEAPLDPAPAITHNPLGADPAAVPSADSTAGTFEGYYSVGFEHAGFAPCADTTETWWTEPSIAEMPGDSAAAAVRARTDLTARYTAAVGDSAGSFGRDVPVWARLRGRLSPRRDVARGAGYGHLGAYTRAFAVDSVEALVRDTVVVDCPAPAHIRP